MKRATIFSAMAGLGLALTGAAHASTLTSFSTTLPADVYTAPTSTTGNVMPHAVGTVTNQYVSPFNDSTSAFVAVLNGGTATYALAGNSLSFVYGSPDSYNTISFLNSSGVAFDTFTTGGTPLSRSQNYFVSIRADGDFSAVRFSSSAKSLEFSNVSISSVPLPASAPLFGAALVALGAVGYAASRKKAVATAA